MNYSNIPKAILTLSYAQTVEDPDTFVQSTTISTATFESTIDGNEYNTAWGEQGNGTNASGNYLFYTGTLQGFTAVTGGAAVWQTLSWAIQYGAQIANVTFSPNMAAETVDMIITQNVADSSLELPVITNADFLSLCSGEVPSAFS